MDELEKLQILYGRGVQLHEQGDFEAAIDCYQTIVHRFPDADLAWYNLGLAHYELGQPDEAADAFLAAARVNGEDGDYWYNAGLALKKAEKYQEAVQCYERAMQCASDDADIAYNLGCCQQAAGDLDRAVAAYEQALAIDLDHAPALGNLAYCVHRLGEYQQATSLYGRLAELRPEDEAARFMVAALNGAGPGRPPDQYVAGLFDAYAATFETDLLEKLSYRVPELLARLVQEEVGLSGPDLVILDLGCGTGLSGQVFVPWKKELVGVDLSAGMVEKAQEKGCYDRLVVGDVLTFLETFPEQADLVVAADLLTYLGELDELFSHAARRTRPGGWFCCSTEHGEAADWALQASGRYVHAPDYVEKTARRAGWKPLARAEEQIRKEQDVWVNGDLFLFVRK